MPRGKGHFWDVWPTEKHCKAWDLGGWIKGCAVQKKRVGTILNDLYIV